MPDLDLVDALPDDDVAKMGALYFLIAYLFPRDYKKVVDNYLFALVEDFDIVICDLEPSENENGHAIHEQCPVQKANSTGLVNSMEEIMTRFSEKAKDQGIEVPRVGDKGTQVAKGSNKIDEVDSIISNVVMATKSLQVEIYVHELVPEGFQTQKKYMDACFYYICQLAKHGKNVKFRTSTTNSLFQHKIKDIYLAFMKDPQILISELSLVNVITGHNLPLSIFWADVDYVFMQMLPTNKAHGMLGVLQFRNHVLTVFNSTGKIYHDWKVLENIESYVKILPALINTLGISKKDPEYHGSDFKELKVYIDSTLPQQTNG
ncbi:Hypothetical predicted protein [Olea europaea subsp. europaea]|uniref:Uncharacterized protein n=1 Tax=Olea europaea subsp. europaea TaxID=158383 RepID=A0A8S0SI34_OLEEU|nr:Hypothetical predicted protein [Olea europaea subsp. europaea]